MDRRGQPGTENGPLPRRHEPSLAETGLCRRYGDLPSNRNGEAEAASRPGWGVLEFTTLGANQHGEPVFSFDGAAFSGTD